MKIQWIKLYYPYVSKNAMRCIESQLFYVNLVSSPAQYFLHEIYVRISAM